MSEDKVVVARSDGQEISIEEFNSLTECPECAEDLVAGRQEQVRLDLEKVITMTKGVDLEQRCSITIETRLCIDCGFQAICTETYGYAGY